MKLLSALLFAVAASSVQANIFSDRLLAEKSRAIHLKLDTKPSSLASAQEVVTEHFFNQTVNHFGEVKGNETYPQYYVVNANHYKPGGPLVLDLGGEWTVTPGSERQGLQHDFIAKYNGLLVGLEHRFYGQSYPSQDPKDLWLLTVEQALADANNFVKTQDFKAGNVTVKAGSKWVAWGGSYSANLAAWARLKYPQSFWAAHAASGPVYAKMDFQEYAYSVDVGIPQIGGSQACVAGLKQATAALDKILLKGNKKQIKDLQALFSLSGVKYPSDFASWSTTFLASSIQYGPKSSLVNNQLAIDYYCNNSVITSSKLSANDKLHALASIVGNATLEYFGGDMEAAYSTINTPVGPPTMSETTSWLWQVCTEFGYWQISLPYAPSTYSKLLTDPYFSWQCKQIFKGVKVIDPNTGRAVDSHRPNTDKINKNYFGTDIIKHTDHIVFANGQIDPWHTLSVLKGTGESIKKNVVVQHFGYHCDEFSGSQSQAAWRGQLLAFWDKWWAEFKGKQGGYQARAARIR
ncbi:peptidase S28 [Fimicolochytrium jonesii]|uniref:peptidase S28 n=1 Tax=Fimicolochytrium jonesii TaxID=1396493 RepID=UPI0022FE8A02|nr:peptidase S28 [Fimicolochytrium jonesii]KAI8826098.1 peptidase S28 [Fimicolochytrium jonesii]